MTHVRVGKDLEGLLRNGVDWVQAGSGGVSTFSSIGPGSPWWVLPAEFEYSEDIIVVNDHGNHFSWEPRFDMPLAEFVAILASVESAFRKVT